MHIYSARVWTCPVHQRFLLLVIMKKFYKERPFCWSSWCSFGLRSEGMRCGVPSLAALREDGPTGSYGCPKCVNTTTRTVMKKTGISTGRSTTAVARYGFSFRGAKSGTFSTCSIFLPFTDSFSVPIRRSPLATCSVPASRVGPVFDASRYRLSVGMCWMARTMFSSAMTDRGPLLTISSFSCSSSAVLESREISFSLPQEGEEKEANEKKKLTECWKEVEEERTALAGTRHENTGEDIAYENTEEGGEWEWEWRSSSFSASPFLCSVSSCSLSDARHRLHCLAQRSVQPGVLEPCQLGVVLHSIRQLDLPFPVYHAFVGGHKVEDEEDEKEKEEGPRTNHGDPFHTKTPNATWKAEKGNAITAVATTREWEACVPLYDSPYVFVPLTESSLFFPLCQVVQLCCGGADAASLAHSLHELVRMLYDLGNPAPSSSKRCSSSRTGMATAFLDRTERLRLPSSTNQDGGSDEHHSPPWNVGRQGWVVLSSRITLASSTRRTTASGKEEHPHEDLHRWPCAMCRLHGPPPPPPASSALDRNTMGTTEVMAQAWKEEATRVDEVEQSPCKKWPPWEVEPPSPPPQESLSLLLQETFHALQFALEKVWKELEIDEALLALEALVHLRNVHLGFYCCSPFHAPPDTVKEKGNPRPLSPLDTRTTTSTMKTPPRAFSDASSSSTWSSFSSPSSPSWKGRGENVTAGHMIHVTGALLCSPSLFQDLSLYVQREAGSLEDPLDIMNFLRLAKMMIKMDQASGRETLFTASTTSTMQIKDVCGSTALFPPSIPTATTTMPSPDEGSVDQKGSGKEKVWASCERCPFPMVGQGTVLRWQAAVEAITPQVLQALTQPTRWTRAYVMRLADILVEEDEGWLSPRIPTGMGSFPNSPSTSSMPFSASSRLSLPSSSSSSFLACSSPDTIWSATVSLWAPLLTGVWQEVSRRWGSASERGPSGTRDEGEEEACEEGLSPCDLIAEEKAAPDHQETATAHPTTTTTTTPPRMGKEWAPFYRPHDTKAPTLALSPSQSVAWLHRVVLLEERRMSLLPSETARGGEEVSALETLRMASHTLLQHLSVFWTSSAGWPSTSSSLVFHSLAACTLFSQYLRRSYPLSWNGARRWEGRGERPASAASCFSPPAATLRPTPPKRGALTDRIKKTEDEGRPHGVEGTSSSFTSSAAAGDSWWREGMVVPLPIQHALPAFIETFSWVVTQVGYASSGKGERGEESVPSLLYKSSSSHARRQDEVEPECCASLEDTGTLSVTSLLPILAHLPEGPLQALAMEYQYQFFSTSMRTTTSHEDTLVSPLSPTNRSSPQLTKKEQRHGVFFTTYSPERIRDLVVQFSIALEAACGALMKVFDTLSPLARREVISTILCWRVFHTGLHIPSSQRWRAVFCLARWNALGERPYPSHRVLSLPTTSHASGTTAISAAGVSTTPIMEAMQEGSRKCISVCRWAEQEKARWESFEVIRLVCEAATFVATGEERAAITGAATSTITTGLPSWSSTTKWDQHKMAMNRTAHQEGDVDEEKQKEEAQHSPESVRYREKEEGDALFSFSSLKNKTSTRTLSATATAVVAAVREMGRTLVKELVYREKILRNQQYAAVEEEKRLQKVLDTEQQPPRVGHQKVHDDDAETSGTASHSSTLAFLRPGTTTPGTARGKTVDIVPGVGRLERRRRRGGRHRRGYFLPDSIPGALTTTSPFEPVTGAFVGTGETGVPQGTLAVTSMETSCFTHLSTPFLIRYLRSLSTLHIRAAAPYQIVLSALRPRAYCPIHGPEHFSVTPISTSSYPTWRNTQDVEEVAAADEKDRRDPITTTSSLVSPVLSSPSLSFSLSAVDRVHILAVMARRRLHDPHLLVGLLRGLGLLPRSSTNRKEPTPAPLSPRGGGGDERPMGPEMGHSMPLVSPALPTTSSSSSGSPLKTTLDTLEATPFSSSLPHHETSTPLSLSSSSPSLASWMACSLSPIWKAKLLRHLGDLPSQRCIRPPAHPTLQGGVFFFSREEVIALGVESPSSLAMAVVGLVNLRQFENTSLEWFLEALFLFPPPPTTKRMTSTAVTAPSSSVLSLTVRPKGEEFTEGPTLSLSSSTTPSPSVDCNEEDLLLSTDGMDGIAHGVGPLTRIHSTLLLSGLVVSLFRIGMPSPAGSAKPLRAMTTTIEKMSLTRWTTRIPPSWMTKTVRALIHTVAHSSNLFVDIMPLIRYAPLLPVYWETVSQEAAAFRQTLLPLPPLRSPDLHSSGEGQALPYPKESINSTSITQEERAGTNEEDTLEDTNTSEIQRILRSQLEDLQDVWIDMAQKTFSLVYHRWQDMTRTISSSLGSSTVGESYTKNTFLFRQLSIGLQLLQWSHGKLTTTRRRGHTMSTKKESSRLEISMDAIREVVGQLAPWMDVETAGFHLRHSPEDYTHVLRIALAAIRRPEHHHEEEAHKNEEEREEEEHPIHHGTASTQASPLRFASSTRTPSFASPSFPLLVPLTWDTHLSPLLDTLIQVAHSLSLNEALLAWSMVHTSMQEDFIQRYGARDRTSHGPQQHSRQPSSLPLPTHATPSSTTRLRPLASERAFFWKLQHLQRVLRGRFLTQDDTLPRRTSRFSSSPSSSSSSPQLAPSASRKLSSTEWELLTWLMRQPNTDLS